MSVVPLDSAEGKITANSISDKNGNILLPKGVTLTEALITALTNRGVTEIEIEQKNHQLVDSETVELINGYMGHFKSPKMVEFRQCLVQYFQSN